jgi:adenylate kinase
MDDMRAKRSSKLTFALALITIPANAQLQPPRTIIMIGPPGSGKTVQAEVLQKVYKIPAISMLQLLKREVSRKSAMSRALGASLDSMLSDDQANTLMKARILQPDVANGFIVDGYPGTDGQAKVFDDWLTELKLPKPIIVVLNVSDEVSRERLSRRGRIGDEPVNIERRLTDYRKVGQLVERWYGAERIVRVDGAGSPSEVTKRITTGIEAVRSSPVLKDRSTQQ